MNVTDLNQVANSMFTNHKGLLAIDESTKTCNKRFATYGIPQTIELRRSYRELILTTPGLNESIGGVILFDETIRQSKADGQSFIEFIRDLKIVPGIKVDAGTEPMESQTRELLTVGLDGLKTRFEEYRAIGARFAKWRAVFAITDETPTTECIRQNARSLAKYARICQEAGMVPVIEPEVLMNGNHSMQRCQEVTETVQSAVFEQLSIEGVELEGMILKPNMVVPGMEQPDQESSEAIAKATVDCLRMTTPAKVPVIAFLSGGQSGPKASERLNAMNLHLDDPYPWSLAYSFGRAIQEPGLRIWNGKLENSQAAQTAIYHRAMCNAAARAGTYTAQVESDLSELQLTDDRRNESRLLAGIAK